MKIKVNKTKMYRLCKKFFPGVPDMRSTVFKRGKRSGSYSLMFTLSNGTSHMYGLLASEKWVTLQHLYVFEDIARNDEYYLNPETLLALDMVDGILTLKDIHNILYFGKLLTSRPLDGVHAPEEVQNTQDTTQESQDVPQDGEQPQNATHESQDMPQSDKQPQNATHESQDMPQDAPSESQDNHPVVLVPPHEGTRFYIARSLLSGVTVYDCTTGCPAYEYGACRDMDCMSAATLSVHLNVQTWRGLLDVCREIPAMDQDATHESQDMPQDAALTLPDQEAPLSAVVDAAPVNV